jgi:hypothetical protein
MTYREFIDKFEYMESHLAYDGKGTYCLCYLFDRYFNELFLEFIKCFKPKKLHKNDVWFSSISITQSQLDRFIALQIFKQHCIANKIYKDLKG